MKKLRIRRAIDVKDFERYLSTMSIQPTDGEREWYTFVLSEMDIDSIVIGVIARWITMYTDHSFDDVYKHLESLVQNMWATI